ncbi:MAG: tetratricopeptide repeat protein [Methanophagales archaeon]|nr:tetratricopeptide repeat protein [Methanophagales archaeon]
MNTKKKLLIGLIIATVVFTAFLTTFYVVNLPSQRISEWYHQGHVYMDKGKYEEAIECFDKILEIEPKHRTVFQYKAYALFNLGRFNEALNCYDEFVSRLGGYQSDYAAPFYVMRGHILLHLESFEEADECFKKALEREEINKASNKKYKVYGLFGKGMAAAEFGEYMYAQQRFDKALEILESGRFPMGIPTIYGDSLDEEGMKGLIYFCKGLTYLETKDYPEAVEYLDLAEHYIKPRPLFEDADANNWYNKGKVLLEMGHKEEAEECFEKLGELLESK